MSKKVHPLQNKRFYKIKNPSKNFLCALCSAPRSMKYQRNLNHKQYFQIVLISVALSWSFFSIIGPESIFAIFLVWPLFELVNKMLYRKEIPCPYCGFDATWYRRDVKKANELVKQFWATNYPELVNPHNISDVEKNMAKQEPEMSGAASQNIIN